MSTKNRIFYSDAEKKMQGETIIWVLTFKKKTQQHLYSIIPKMNKCIFTQVGGCDVVSWLDSFFTEAW